MNEDVLYNGPEDDLSAGAAFRKPFLERLTRLFSEMDQEYRQVSNQYGFHCKGCEDNCCRTTFYHHTLLEYLYLQQGVEQMGREQQAAALKRAQTVSLQPSAGLFCPLFEEGRCLLYDYRPMICRLHGIAHEVHRPDRVVKYGPGCAAFEATTRGQPYIVFDRTKFYWKLSRLEREARMALGVTRKIKMTVSQMLTAYQPGTTPNEKR